MEQEVNVSDKLKQEIFNIVQHFIISTITYDEEVRYMCVDTKTLMNLSQDIASYITGILPKEIYDKGELHKALLAEKNGYYSKEYNEGYNQCLADIKRAFGEE